ncbi:hypothetical protein ACFLWS_01550 [Chloroflexota bacterium]
MTYKIYLGTSENPPIVSSNLTANSYNPDTLNYDTIYHWRVIARDNHGITTEGPIWSFTTSSAPAPAGGVGGGGGGAPAPKVVVVKTPGFTSTSELKVDTSGIVQGTTRLEKEEGKVVLDIAKNTKLSDSSGKALDTLSVATPVSPPEPPPQKAIVLAYEFGPDGAKFDPALSLTLEYDSETLTKGVAEEELALAFYDKGAGNWIVLESVVNTDNHTINALISHFTSFAIVTPVLPPSTPKPKPAAFSLSNLTIQPAEISPVEAVTITLSVANTGGAEGSYTVVLDINGAKEAEKRVTVKDGGSEFVSFSVSRQEAGRYSITVDGLEGLFTVKALEPVLPPPPPIEVPSQLPTKTSTPVERGINWYIIGIVLGIAVLLVILLLILIRRRRTG